MATEQASDCPHISVTSHGRGWQCADCGVGLLSLMLPIPLPVVEKALNALSPPTQPASEAAGVIA